LKGFKTRSYSFFQVSQDDRQDLRERTIQPLLYAFKSLRQGLYSLRSRPDHSGVGREDLKKHNRKLPTIVLLISLISRHNRNSTDRRNAYRPSRSTTQPSILSVSSRSLDPLPSPSQRLPGTPIFHLNTCSISQCGPPFSHEAQNFSIVYQLLPFFICRGGKTPGVQPRIRVEVDEIGRSPDRGKGHFTPDAVGLSGLVIAVQDG
jgi:hypothetical protein